MELLQGRKILVVEDEYLIAMNSVPPFWRTPAWSWPVPSADWKKRSTM